MVDTRNNNPECDICGSTKGVSFVILTEQPLQPDEAYIPEDPYLVCRDHWQEFIDNDDYHVRTIAPVPNERGGFSRTADSEGEILYDRSVGDSCWIKFTSESELDLEDSEQPSGDSE